MSVREPRGLLTRVTVGESPARLRLGSWFRDRPLMVKFVAVSGALVGATYLVARLTTSVDVHPVVFYTLYGAEVLGFIAYLVLVAGMWVVDPSPRRPPLAVPVDVVIAVDSDDLDQLEPALVGALNVRGLTLVRISDDGDRPAVRDLAERYGVAYSTAPSHGTASAINAALPELTGELILVLDSHLVASPDILDALSGFFADDDVALVHCSTTRRSGDTARADTIDFDRAPVNHGTDSALWNGSAALVRRTALEAIGGMATSTSTSELETSLLLQRAGGRVLLHPEALAQQLDSNRHELGAIDAVLVARRVSGRGRTSWSQRVADAGTMVAALAPLQRGILLIYLALVGIGGIMPFTRFGPVMIALWVLWVATTYLAVIALERGSIADTRGAVSLTPAMIATTLPVIVVVIGLVIIATRWTDSLLRLAGAPAFLPPLDLASQLLLGIIGAVSILTLARFLLAGRRGRRQRRLWRFTVDLRGTVAGAAARCVDLHQSGASFLLPGRSVEIGEVVPVTIDLRSAADTAATAHGRLRVTSVRVATGAGSTVRIGGPIDWDTPESRSAVIEHCYVVEPYAARTRAWVRAARLPVELPARVGGLTATCVDMSENGAAFVLPVSTWRVGETIVAEVRLLDGTLAQGFIEVRSVLPAGDGLVRLGGTASWNDTGWLDGYASVRQDSAPE